MGSVCDPSWESGVLDDAGVRAEFRQPLGLRDDGVEDRLTVSLRGLGQPGVSPDHVHGRADIVPEDAIRDRETLFEFLSLGDIPVDREKPHHVAVLVVPGQLVYGIPVFRTVRVSDQPLAVDDLLALEHPSLVGDDLRRLRGPEVPGGLPDEILRVGVEE